MPTAPAAGSGTTKTSQHPHPRGGSDSSVARLTCCAKKQYANSYGRWQLHNTCARLHASVSGERGLPKFAHEATYRGKTMETAVAMTPASLADPLQHPHSWADAEQHSVPRLGRGAAHASTMLTAIWPCMALTSRKPCLAHNRSPDIAMDCDMLLALPHPTTMLVAGLLHRRGKVHMHSQPA